MEHEGVNAVVTGGGRNVGFEIARTLARGGANVALIDADQDRAQAAAKEIGTESKGTVTAYVCDVADEAAVRTVFAQIESDLSPIQILVNNVAITDRKDVLELEFEEWQRVLSVTLGSVFLCTKYAARHMVRFGTPGAIVNIGSTSGYRGRLNSTAYPAAKAGVLNLTKSLAIQLAPHGIRVNSVTPNQVGSPVGKDEPRPAGSVSNLVGRPAVPLDIAEVVSFLCSPRSSFMTGTDVAVDGGVLCSF